MGIRILSGRAFTDADTARAPKVAIVNRQLVRRDWTGSGSAGEDHFRQSAARAPAEVSGRGERDAPAGYPTSYEPDKFTIVGVADDALYGGLHNSALPLVYVPYAQGSEGDNEHVPGRSRPTAIRSPSLEPSASRLHSSIAISRLPTFRRWRRVCPRRWRSAACR